VDGASLSEEGLWRRPGGGGGGAPSLGTLKDTSRKSPDTGISLSMGAPSHPRGTWYVRGGLHTGDFDR
jgi:hypothetical protein